MATKHRKADLNSFLYLFMYVCMYLSIYLSQFAHFSETHKHINEVVQKMNQEILLKKKKMQLTCEDDSYMPRCTLYDMTFAQSYDRSI